MVLGWVFAVVYGLNDCGGLFGVGFCGLSWCLYCYIGFWLLVVLWLVWDVGVVCCWLVLVMCWFVVMVNSVGLGGVYVVCYLCCLRVFVALVAAGYSCFGFGFWFAVSFGALYCWFVVCLWWFV